MRESFSTLRTTGLMILLLSSAVADDQQTKQKKPPTIGEPARLGDVEVTVKQIRIGPSLSLRGSKKEIVKSKEDFTTITVEIKNVSKRKKIDFEGWTPRGGEELLPILEDNEQNKYKIIRPRLGESFQIAKETSIYPGKSIEEVLVFEPPVDGSKYLLLFLPANELGVENDFTILLPPKSVSVKNLKPAGE